MVHVKYWAGVFKRALALWLENNAFAYAGALAFFTLFSMAPVVIVLVSIIGFFFGEEAAQGQIVVQLEQAMGQEAAQAVETAVARSQLKGGNLVTTIFSVLAMLLGATTVFAQMQRALNTLWGVAPKPSRNSLMLLIKARLMSLTVVLSIGFVLLVSLTLSVALRAVIDYAGDWIVVPGIVLTSLEFLLSLVVISLLFGAIFRVLPDVRLSWRDVALGAVFTALAFSLGRSLIAMYLAYTAPASAHGAAGSVVMLLLWVNYSSLILLFGTALTRAHVEARGRRIIPRNTAVRVHSELIED
jgi:membrane protein